MRGGIYPLKARKDAAGHEQKGKRYGIVVTASRFQGSSRWQVVPTSSSARAVLIRPEVDLGGELGRTVALVDAIESIDPEQRLGDLIGYLTTDEMQAVERALILLLGLPGREELF